MSFKILVSACFLVCVAATLVNGDNMHPRFGDARLAAKEAGQAMPKAVVIPGDDQNPQRWLDSAKKTLEEALAKKNNNNIAKNVILFLGDGMGISTITAGTRLCKLLFSSKQLKY
jgi:alkaline phosphatase